MSQQLLERTERTEVQRLPDRGSYDREEIYRILDEGLICHVGIAVDGKPFVIPMGYARWGNRLILHGSVLSRLLREMAEGVEVCVTVTHLDGLVLARSTFHHSMNYRSAVIFGKAVPITDRKEKNAALEALVEHLVPGRGAEARGANKKELEATAVLALEISEASAKVRKGPPKDNKSDLDLDVWAGVIPLTVVPGAPVTAPDLKPGLEVPEYVTGYQRG